MSYGHEPGNDGELVFFATVAVIVSIAVVVLLVGA